MEAGRIGQQCWGDRAWHGSIFLSSTLLPFLSSLFGVEQKLLPLTSKQAVFINFTEESGSSGQICPNRFGGHKVGCSHPLVEFLE